MSEQISFDSEAVSAAAQVITREVDTIHSAVKKFMQELQDKNVITDGKFPLLAKLQEVMEQDVQRINDLNGSLEDVKNILTKFLELAEDAADGSVWDRL